MDFYGPADGLPPALSGHNQYYLWGTRGYDGSVILRVNGPVLRYRRLCRSSAVIATFGTSPYVMPYEHDRPVILCRGCVNRSPPNGRSSKASCKEHVRRDS